MESGNRLIFSIDFVIGPFLYSYSYMQVKLSKLMSGVFTETGFFGNCKVFCFGDGGLKFKKTLNVVADVLTPEEARHLGDVFQRVDQDRDGEIRLEDLDEAVASQSSFSASLKHNLKEMRTMMAKNPKMPLNIKPFIAFTSARSKSG